MINSSMNLQLMIIIIFLVGLLHLLAIPFTKVEESFGVQSCHDFLFISKRLSSIEKWLNIDEINVQNSSVIDWDHEHYPGVVHRTFLFNFLLSLLTKPIQLLFQLIDPNNIDQYRLNLQISIRSSLLILFVYSYGKLLQTIRKIYDVKSKTHGKQMIILITLLTATQFHLLFYSSRTLPNTYGLVLMLLAYRYWLEKQWSKFIFLFAFTVLVIRFELIIIFSLICLIECFYYKQLPLLDIFKYGIPSGIISLLITILFDSFMWNKWIWPEGDTIIFNIIENKSHLWGIQPFHWYFTNVLPNIFFTTIFLSPIGLSLIFFKSNEDCFYHKSIFISLSFIFVYSFLPHKELRFIIYVVPLFNVIFAHIIIAINDLLNDHGFQMNLFDKINKFIPFIRCFRLKKFIIRNLKHTFQYVIIVNFILNLILTLIKLFISSYNYPGGYAVAMINQDIMSNFKNSDQSKIGVYVCDLAAQSGFTRFLQLSSVYYDKEPKFSIENFSNHQQQLYLIIEPKYYDEIFNYSTPTYQSSDELNQIIVDDLNSKTFTCQPLQTVITLNHHRLEFQPILSLYKCQLQSKL